ncbi:Crp/Fnr family transcriptional regulator [Neptuniibacter sp. QD29_5]|uniref:Crp/Fnr family transcriptional regulator n=1 Tax=Neptuniibacter sp. QD29_5 TaxID=3398207 RepID=UPI0039F5D3C3
MCPVKNSYSLDEVLLELSQQLQLSPEAFSALKQHSGSLALKCFQQEEMLLSAGEVGKHVFFITEGLVRFFYLTENGKEHNKSFAAEQQFAGPLCSFAKPEPCRFYIQALDTTQVLQIPLQVLNELFGTSLEWANIGRMYFEEVARRKSLREGQFLLDSAEVRYLAFVEDYPKLVERLPLYQIASYIGVTDVALSRIRKRIEK